VFGITKCVLEYAYILYWIRSAIINILMFTAESLNHLNTGDVIPWPIPLAARSKVCVFYRSLVGIAGSNPTGGMDVCLL
jgi:hypothetical protein